MYKLDDVISVGSAIFLNQIFFLNPAGLRSQILVKILAISDQVIPFIYSPNVVKKFGHVDFVVACGDLPYYYLEFIISTLNKPLFYVRGNHDPVTEYGEFTQRNQPHGGIDLHRKGIRHSRILIAGIEGSIRYKKEGIYQYTQHQMWFHVFRLIPRFLINKMVYGRYLDIFMTHAPPWKIHDREDFPHQGIKAFRWVIQVFQPKIHFHGHTHIYRPDTIVKTQVGATRVLNVYGYLETEIRIPLL